MAPTLLFLAIFFIVGFGCTFALTDPESLPFPVKLSLVFCFGYGVPAGTSFVLMVVGALNGLSVLLLLLIVTGVLYFVASRRHGLRRHALSLVREIRDSNLLKLGLVVLIGFAVYRAAFPAELNFLQSTAFRYWADGAEIADAGSLPDQVMHWGSYYSPTTSKVVLNSFTASLTFIFGDNPLSLLGPLLWLASVGLAVAVWGLFHELGLVRTGAFAAVFLLANPGWLNPEFTTDLTTYKTEIMGRLVALAALTVAVRALRQQRPRAMIMPALLFALAALTHITPLVVAIVTLTCFGLSLIFVERHSITRVVRALAVVGTVVVPLVLVVPNLAGGDLGFEGFSGSNAHPATAEIEDPTAFFAAPREHLEGRGTGRTELPSKLDSVELYGATAFGKHLEGSGAYFGLAIVTIVSLGIGLFAKSPIRHVGFVALGLGVGLVLLTIFFLARYDTYIPAATGLRRLFDYNALVIVLPVMALVEVGLVSLRERARNVQVVFVIATVVALIAVLATMLWTLPSSRDLRRTAQSSAPFEWLRRSTTCGTRVLASIRSEGVFQAMAARIGVLEGMSPYLRPSMLREVNNQLIRAHQFFAVPRDGTALLREWDVHYLFVKREAALGGSKITSAELRGLGSNRAFREVYSDDVARIYEVAEASEERMDRPPGYFCG